MKNITVIGLLIAALVLGAVEVYALLTPQDGDTISEILNELFDAYPVLLFLSGIVIGHIIFPLNSSVMSFIRSKRNGK